MLLRRFPSAVSAGLATIAAASCLLSAAPARPAFADDGAGVVTETLSLKHIAPSRLIAVMTSSRLAARSGGAEKEAMEGLAMPGGIERLMPNEAGRTLTVRGTAEGVKALREMVRYLDVGARRVRLPLRLLRYTFPAGSKAPVIDEVGVMTVQAANNTPVSLTAYGDESQFTIEVTPHINGDDSVSIRATFGILAPGGKPSEIRTSKVTSHRRLLPGKPGLIGAVAPFRPEGGQPLDALPPPESLRAKDKPLTVYYLEAAPQVLAKPAVSTAFADLLLMESSERPRL